MSYDGVGPRAVMRSVVFLATGTLAVLTLAGCGSEDQAGKPLAKQHVGRAARAKIAEGGTLRWAVDAVPDTLNTFQADADATTGRIAQAVLPSMYRMNASGRPERNADYLESAKVIETEPKQVVLYKLNQQAVWSDGREIGAADFAAQWRALSGKDSAYWTARNAGYDRIEGIERGADDLEVRVTFAKPYADWRSLFSPLYPKDVMGSPDSFNDGARHKLKVTAGPFTVQKVDTKQDRVRLTRNPRWWGKPAKLSEIVLRAVPHDKRADALAAGELDLAEIDPATARRVRSGADGLRGFEVRKSLEPAYTQLALNGADGPLADERVRRAVARALDRKKLAEVVLKPLGLPAVPVGSHLALAGQAAYADNSGALGGQDTDAARALLADAGWVPGGPIKEQKKGEEAAGPKGTKSHEEKSHEEKPHEEKPHEEEADEEQSGGGDEGTYIVGEDGKAPHETERDYIGRDRAGQDRVGRDLVGRDRVGLDHENKHGEKRPEGSRHLAQDGSYPHVRQGGAPGAYAPMGTAAPGTAVKALAKNGKPLTLRFVLPSGTGSEPLRAVADRVTRMLKSVGIGTEITKVSDESYFKDHIASGEYDLALYSWPTSAFPATDARPIYAKPVPAADGSLSVEQNYTRVGTDQVDQLFDQAIATLDEGEARSLIRKADSRIWAAAGSIPLYQRPQLTAAWETLANAGAFGFRTPVFEDMGFLRKGAKPAPNPSS